MNLATTIGMKVRYALKRAGITVQQLSVAQPKPGEFHIGAILTNDYPAEQEESVCVVKEDYRIRQVEETNAR